MNQNDEDTTNKRQPLRCRWGFHPWTVWGPVQKKPLHGGGMIEEQDRTCTACGFIDRREI